MGRLDATMRLVVRGRGIALIVAIVVAATTLQPPAAFASETVDVILDRNDTTGDHKVWLDQDLTMHLVRSHQILRRVNGGSYVETMTDPGSEPWIKVQPYNYQDVWLTGICDGSNQDICTYFSSDNGATYGAATQFASPNPDVPHNPMVRCNASNDCLLQWTTTGVTQRVWGSHWNGTSWCTSAVIAQGITAHPNMMDPSGTSGEYWLHYLAAIASAILVGNPYDVRAKRITMGRNGTNECTVTENQDLRVSDGVFNRRAFGYINQWDPAPWQMFGTSVSSATASPSGERWVMWANRIPTDTYWKLRLKHGTNGSTWNSQLEWTASGQHVVFGNVTYDPVLARFYAFYMKLTPFTTRFDICYRSVAAGSTSWGAETCPALLADLKGKSGPKTFDDEYVLGAVYNGNIAVFHERSCGALSDPTAPGDYCDNAVYRNF